MGSREGLTSGSLQDVEAFYHFMMRCPADRSRAELYHTRPRDCVRESLFSEQIHSSERFTFMIFCRIGYLWYLDILVHLY